MLNEQTIVKLNAMKLYGMARGFADRIGMANHAQLSHEEFFGMVVDDEKQYRENSKLTRLLSRAKMKQQAALEDVDFRHPRGLDKQILVELSRGNWLPVHQNILITGPTGVGKSFLACALGNQACRSGYATNYFRFSRLLEVLLASNGDGTHLKLLGRLAKTSLLILDDFGLTTFGVSEAKDLLEILEDRYGTGSTILTSQLPTKQWHQIFTEPTIADAICDRLFHNAFKIELKGESMRKRPTHK
jgi:DNA replication protein DnaC